MVVGLGQAAHDPVVPHYHYSGSIVFMLLGDGSVHHGGSCPPLQRASFPRPPSVSSFVILQRVLHQRHGFLHRRPHLHSSTSGQPRVLIAVRRWHRTIIPSRSCYSYTTLNYGFRCWTLYFNVQEVLSAFLTCCCNWIILLTCSETVQAAFYFGLSFCGCCTSGNVYVGVKHRFEPVIKRTTVDTTSQSRSKKQSVAKK